MYKAKNTFLHFSTIFKKNIALFYLFCVFINCMFNIYAENNETIQNIIVGEVENSFFVHLQYLVCIYVLNLIFLYFHKNINEVTSYVNIPSSCKCLIAGLTYI